MKNHLYKHYKWKERRRKERRERNKQINILHTQVTYCTHKQQLHQHVHVCDSMFIHELVLYMCTVLFVVTKISTHGGSTHSARDAPL